MKKPQSAVRSQLSFGERFNNRNLFADHFLRERLADLPEWQEAQGLEEAFAAINKLYQERVRSFTDATNEAQTEHDFIRPVLDILWGETQPGDCYDVQDTIPNLDSYRKPDYALFRYADDRRQADQRKKTIEYWDDVACVGEAKP